MERQEHSRLPESLKIIVVGASGNLGAATVQLLTQETPHDVIAITRDFIATTTGYTNFDSTNARDWKEMAESRDLRADVVINAAAMTNVDLCETERERAWRTNVDLVDSILLYCRRTNAYLIQVSTDYVFDGTAGPYAEGSRPEPINYYGRTKLAAENLCTKSSTQTTIVRTMWLYGNDRAANTTFSTWVRRQATQKDELPIVTDEIGNPTLYSDIANSLSLLAENRGPAVIHAAGRDRVSRLEWAKIILETEGNQNVSLRPIHSADLNRAAARPLKSGLITVHPQLTGITDLTGVRKGERTNKVMREREA